jgi:branched-chain amino acid transport system substrate-binding protein
MNKFALLVGVSDYQKAIEPLPAAISDVEKMRQVFQNPELSDFKPENIKVLLNCDAQLLRVEVENFFSHCSKQDLLLFYFSGHGIRDERGDLYLATCDTRIEAGRLLKATAVRTDRIHECMRDSDSKQQIIILDCCFSGAFVRGLSVKGSPSTAEIPEIREKIREKLNEIQVEGRAILTSSTATQFSQIYSETESIYTRYLVEGITTGQADQNKDGWITTEELHNYVQHRVETNHKEMRPEFYPVQSGSHIRLTQVPTSDPKDRYSKAFKQLLKQNGNISDVDRHYLDQLQSNLGLPEYEAQAIEARIRAQLAKPSHERENALQRYRDAVAIAYRESYPISARNQESLRLLKQALKLTEDDAVRIENEVKSQRGLKNTVTRLLRRPSILTVCLFFLGFASLIFLFNRSSEEGLNPDSLSSNSISGGSIPPEPTVIDEFIFNDSSISIGEETLFPWQSGSLKSDGMQAFRNQNWQFAIQKFQASLDTQLNDPETRIYLNNARARSGGKYISIVVSVPVGGNADVAAEILRGVAQAQEEIHQNGGIGKNNYLLQIAIANDDNDKGTAATLAQKFIQRTDFLAVIGHNSSSASQAAGPIYQSNQLVMITPTSLASEIGEIGQYIFRTNPGVDKLAETLQTYILNNSEITKLGICYDAGDLASLSSREIFVNKIGLEQFESIACDFEDPKFNAEDAVQDVIDKNIDGLLLFPSVNDIQPALAVASEAKRSIQNLYLFSSATMYTGEALFSEGQILDGMVLSVPWHRDVNEEFSKNAGQMWGGPVNWRTAASYDATQAIASGLENIDVISQEITQTRQELQERLSEWGFEVINASTETSSFQFSRNNADIPAYLVKVKQEIGNNYDFCLLLGQSPSDSRNCD